MEPETRMAKEFQGQKLRSNKLDLVFHTDDATWSWSEWPPIMQMVSLLR